MRRLVTFPCAGATLYATLDEGPAESGVLIVSGGNEIRIGAHRGMARLAQDLASRGIPVFRFDRRGIGDSGGENGGFESSAPDITAAMSAFRDECPSVRAIVAFGNCDAASALLLHRPKGLSGLVLANPWAFPGDAGLPPPAAIKAHYRQRLLSVSGWKKLLGGGVDLRKVVRGLARLAKREPPGSLLERMAQNLSEQTRPAWLVIATRDATGLSFNKAFKTDAAFSSARDRVRVIEIDSASHSFAPETDYQRLLAILADAAEVSAVRTQ